MLNVSDALIRVESLGQDPLPQDQDTSEIWTADGIRFQQCALFLKPGHPSRPMGTEATWAQFNAIVRGGVTTEKLQELSDIVNGLYPGVWDDERYHRLERASEDLYSHLAIALGQGITREQAFIATLPQVDASNGDFIVVRHRISRVNWPALDLGVSEDDVRDTHKRVDVRDRVQDPSVVTPKAGVNFGENETRYLARQRKLGRNGKPERGGTQRVR